MLSAFRNALKIPELRGKILFTVAIIAVYRLGSHLPVPGVDFDAVQQFLEKLQSASIVQLAHNNGILPLDIFPGLTPGRFALAVLTLTAGTALIMWLGELITQRGIGNGMSILIFSAIVSTLPSEGANILRVNKGFIFGLVCFLGLLIVVAVIFVEQAQRRIPVTYAKRMVGRRMFGGSSTYIPLKVNQAGVIPIIFASSLLYIPALAVNFTDQR